ncbi:MAG: sugar phosphate isomerase/epimerase family protein [Nitrososphaerota archaeon]
MRIGLSTAPFMWSYTLFEAINIVRELGYSGISLRTGEPHAWPFNMSAEDRRRLSLALEEKGLEPMLICPSWGDINLASPEPDAREFSIKVVKENIVLAQNLGFKVVSLIAGRRYYFTTPPFEKSWKWSAESLNELAYIAEKLNVMLALEPLPGTNLVEEPKQVIELLKEVNSKNLKAQFDTVKANVIKSKIPIEEQIDILKNHLVSVCLGDNDGTKLDHLPLGHGTVNFKVVINKLKEIGYNDFLIVDLWYPQNPKEGAKISMDFLKRIII